MEKKISPCLIAAMFPLVLLYYEVIFRLSTVQGLWRPGTVCMVLFCIAYAGLVWLLATLSGRRRVNYWITFAYMFTLSLPFLIEYFVYRKFKVLYNLSTTLGGAGDAVGDFQADIWLMVFSREGLVRIALFFLPTVLFLVLGRKLATPQKISRRSRIAGLLIIAAVYAAGWLGIAQSPRLALVTGKEYDFQGVVSELGLITGLGMDAKQYFLGSGTAQEFEQVPTMPQMAVPTAPTQETAADPDPTQTEPPVTQPVVYTPNVLDMDFASLPDNGGYSALNTYVAAQTPSMKNEFTGLFAGKNLIFITAEAFTAEVIDPVLTPTLYRLANKGIRFLDYYQPTSAGTTGGEYQNIFGMMPTEGGMSLKMTQDNCNYFTIGSQLDRLGYYGKAYHNHDYTFYDRYLTHVNLGYSDGFLGFGNGMEEFVTDQWPKSDLEMFRGTFPSYVDKQPFNVYYMTVSGHSSYTLATNCMTNQHWSRVKHLKYSDPVKGYLAANLELEDSMAYLVEQLELAGIADDTVIVIATDHFPYGLDEECWQGNMPYLAELYGHTVMDNFQRDHSRLIIWSGCLEEMEPIVVDTPVFSPDILPTLSNLFGTEFDSRLMIGRDVFSDAPALVFNMSYQWKTEYGTYMDGEFYPADETVQIPEGYVEAVKAIVRNKINYCSMVLHTDYFGYLFGEKD